MSHPTAPRTPCILQLHGKHGDEFYVCNNSTDFMTACIEAVNSRLDYDYYDDDDGADDIVDKRDGVAAYKLLQKRKGHEYEGFTIVYSKPLRMLSITHLDS